MSLNFLEETIEAIERSHHSIEDIVHIGSRRTGHSCTWDEFTKLADRTYDDGFGGQEVARDLTITFRDNGILFRWEYDGAEWWKYIHEYPMKQNLLILEQRWPITKIIGDGDSLREMNSGIYEPYEESIL